MDKALFTAAITVIGVLAADQGEAGQLNTLEPPVRVGTYYEQNGVANCDQQSHCFLAFSRIPSGRQLWVQQLACSLESTAQQPVEVTLGVIDSSTGGYKRRKFLPAPLIATAGGTHVASVLLNTNYPITATPAVQVNIGTLSTSYIWCQISGQLRSL